MATRRRSTRSRPTTRRRRTTTTTRRRRPKVATTLGSACALAVVAAWLRLPWWPGRAIIIGGVLALILLWFLWFLWSRRGDIYDEMQARKAAETDQQ